MSVEDALFIFSMFGFSLLTFGFMGGYLRFFGELMAIWLMTAGLIVLSVGIIVLFVRMMHSSMISQNNSIEEVKLSFTFFYNTE